VPPDAAGRISRYDVRVGTERDPILPGDAQSFIRGLPGQAAS